MGQQQLLLIILVMIIIGVATVVAINTMAETTLSANLDSVIHSMVARVSVDTIDIALPGGELP